MSNLRVVLCTFPQLDVARDVARQLVDRQLAACVNLLPAAESVYRWQGEVQTDAEVLAILKTSAAGLAALERELTALHPYEVPEFIALDPTHVAAPYAAWLEGAVRASDGD